jgi:prepilin-type N-terminal cleavage/methylation domain-containing protein
MNIPSHPASQKGFTLIELLVVITIIAVLAGLVISQAPKMMEDARKLEIRNTLISLTTGIRNYQVEYNRYPVDPNQTGGGGGDDAPPLLTDENTKIIDTLMGDAAQQPGSNNSSGGSGSVNLNPKGIEFVTFKVAKNGRNGLVGAQSPFSLIDMWGSPFYVLLDTNLDRKLENPDVQNQDPKISQNQVSPPPQYLPTDVAVYSIGKDLTQMTGDDIVSWRD